MTKLLTGLFLACTWGTALGCADDDGLFHNSQGADAGALAATDAAAQPDAAPLPDADGVAADTGFLPDAAELPDAGFLPDAADPTRTARIVGVITNTIFGRTYDAQHPAEPIDQVTVHVRTQIGGPDLASATTQADGRFDIPVAPGQDYVIQWDVPQQFYVESDDRQLVPALVDAEVRAADQSFYLKGVSFVVSSRTDGAKLEGVRVTVVDPNIGNLLAGPVLTDVEGYVHLNSTLVPGTLVLERAGFVTYRLQRPSLDTSSTVFGGAALEEAGY